MEKKQQSKKTGFIIGGAVVLILVIALVFWFATADGRTYARAMQLEESGAYQEAIAVYESIAGYQDAGERILSCTYKKAQKLEGDGDYTSALEIYIGLGNYQDAVERCNACNYANATRLLQEGKTDEAYEVFITIRDYGDVNTLLETNSQLLLVADYNNKINAYSTVGSTVVFGRTEQDNLSWNGKERIEWIVLAVDGDYSLLISKSSIGYQPYGYDFKDTKWTDSKVRKWLNNDFLKQSFTSAEQDMIMYPVTSKDMSWALSPDKAHSKNEKVFLLSKQEATTYMKGHLACTPTAFVKAEEKKVVSSLSKAESWWLRDLDDSLGLKQIDIVKGDGSVSSNQVDCYAGVRPAIWIDTKAVKSLIKWDSEAYEHGTEAMQQSEYAEAIKYFGDAGSCLDAQDRYRECYYLQGLQLLEQGEFEKAYSSLGYSKGWADAYQIMTENTDLRKIHMQKVFAVGTTVQFGTYKSSIDSYKGTHFFPDNKIVWTVLDYQEGKALLISSAVIDYRSFGNEESVWETSYLRGWLNGTFLNQAFTEQEKAVIVTTSVDNSAEQNRPGKDIAGSNTTEDKIYLLSYAELMRYYPDEKSADTFATSYALYGGSSSTTNNKKQVVESQKLRWWLRTPADLQLGWADAYSTSGKCISYELKLHLSEAGVRPVLWIDTLADYFVD